MNNTENDDYWNESKVSTFNFERDDKTSDSVFFEDALSSNSEKENVTGLFAHSHSDQIIRKETIGNYLSETHRQWILQDESDYQEVYTAHNVNPDEEIRLLRRHMKERWTPRNVEDTINRISYGRPYTFELYKSFSLKKKLLKCAVESADGDAILAVTVFLARTLKKSLFRQLIMDYPIAISHYIHFLYTRRQMTEMNDILESLGRSREAMMKQMAVACQNHTRIQQRLTLLLKNHSVDTWERQMIDNYLKLIEWQAAASKQKNDPTIVDRTANEFIKYYYSCNMSANISNTFKLESQPETLAKLLRFSDKQLLVVKMHANCEENKWDVVKNLLVTKSWVGGVRLMTDLPIDKVLVQLQKYGAPNILIDEILSCVTDAELKIDIARNLGRHSIVIEAYSKKKDRNRLLQYMALLEPQSDDWLYVRNCLARMECSPRLKTETWMRVSSVHLDKEIGALMTCLHVSEAILNTVEMANLCTSPVVSY